MSKRYNLEINEDTLEQLDFIQEKLPKLNDHGAVLVACVMIVHKMLSGEGTVTLPPDKAKELFSGSE